MLKKGGGPSGVCGCITGAGGGGWGGGWPPLPSDRLPGGVARGALDLPAASDPSRNRKSSPVAGWRQPRMSVPTADFFRACGIFQGTCAWQGGYTKQEGKETMLEHMRCNCAQH